MIVPWLRGFMSWSFVPVTWAIVITNVLIFFTSIDQRNERANVKNDFQNAEDIVRSGQLYYQFKNSGKTHLSVNLNDDEWQLLGFKSLHDQKFVNEFERFSFQGDQIEIKKWKESFFDFQQILLNRYTYMFGLSSKNQGILNWITYQFTHANFIHLIGNMLMVLIFGAVMEIQFGGVMLVVIYLLGGICGGFGFLFLSVPSLTPMVGASGAISAIMAFYIVTERKRNVPCFYFMAPFQGYHGIIYVPTWMFYPLCFLPDIAGYLSAPTEFGGGVAYAAHLGGIGFGFCFGLVWLLKKIIYCSS